MRLGVEAETGQLEQMVLIGRYGHNGASIRPQRPVGALDQRVSPFVELRRIRELERAESAVDDRIAEGVVAGDRRPGTRPERSPERDEASGQILGPRVEHDRLTGVRPWRVLGIQRPEELASRDVLQCQLELLRDALGDAENLVELVEARSEMDLEALSRQRAASADDAPDSPIRRRIRRWVPQRAEEPSVDREVLLLGTPEGDGCGHHGVCEVVEVCHG
ncbi:hypothetical protein ABC195_11510 [Microbacterium sp. 2P01SA-2]|uniref:hypothetical protein n=1 Tax=Microbacterium sp. 2P01SA-2 TaxID=3132290 RepID=UPI00399EF238